MLVTGVLRNLPTFDATITESSNNQRLEKCVRRFVLLHNWALRFFLSFLLSFFVCLFVFLFCFFWLAAYDRHGHNLVFLTFTLKQLDLNSSCLASDRYQHEIEAKCVRQSKMAAKAKNDLASAINTSGTSQNARH